MHNNECINVDYSNYLLRNIYPGVPYIIFVINGWKNLFKHLHMICAFETTWNDSLVYLGVAFCSWRILRYFKLFRKSKFGFVWRGEKIYDSLTPSIFHGLHDFNSFVQWKIYEKYFSRQKWDFVRISNTFQWNKNPKKLTIYNILRTLILRNSNNADKLLSNWDINSPKNKKMEYFFHIE